MAYAVVRTDNLSGIVDGSKLITGIFYSGTNETAVDNGAIVTIGDMVDPIRDTYKVTANATGGLNVAGTPGKLALVATPELNYGEGSLDIAQFTNKAAALLRCYVLESGDVFSVTKEAFSTEPGSTDVYATLTNGSEKMTASATGTGAFGKIIKTDVIAGKKFYVIRVN